MGKCIVCGKDENENYMVGLVVDGKPVKCCPLCTANVKGNITSMEYTKILREDPEKKATKKIDVYYKVNPEYFANATHITLSFTYENEVPLENYWERAGKLHLLSIALGHPDDMSYIEKMIEEKDELTLKIFNSIEPITKEEYEREE